VLSESDDEAHGPTRRAPGTSPTAGHCYDDRTACTLGPAPRKRTHGSCPRPSLSLTSNLSLSSNSSNSSNSEPLCHPSMYQSCKSKRSGQNCFLVHLTATTTTTNTTTTLPNFSLCHPRYALILFQKHGAPDHVHLNQSSITRQPPSPAPSLPSPYPTYPSLKRAWTASAASSTLTTSTSSSSAGLCPRPNQA
jgi:hypothetical protein